jgi:hypothetical protein
LFFNSHLLKAQTLSSSKMTSQWILDSIEEMPLAGGYVLNDLPAQKLSQAFYWQYLSNGDITLLMDPNVATPSYCTTATYMIFYKALQKYWATNKIIPEKEIFKKFKPQRESDGLRIWGRWNSNGPGTAKFFFDSQIGTNFDDLSFAKPGDFLKIFWNDQVGRDERGHSVIFLGSEIVDGIQKIHFWSSNKSTNGFSKMTINRSDAVRLLFSRLDKIENINKVLELPLNDDFLASMLTIRSNWEEVKLKTGIKN